MNSKAIATDKIKRVLKHLFFWTGDNAMVFFLAFNMRPMYAARIQHPVAWYVWLFCSVMLVVGGIQDRYRKEARAERDRKIHF